MWHACLDHAFYLYVPGTVKHRLVSTPDESVTTVIRPHPIEPVICLTGHEDGRLCVWNIADGVLIRCFRRLTIPPFLREDSLRAMHQSARSTQHRALAPAGSGSTSASCRLPTALWSAVQDDLRGYDGNASCGMCDGDYCCRIAMSYMAVF